MHRQRYCALHATCVSVALFTFIVDLMLNVFVANGHPYYLIILAVLNFKEQNVIMEIMHRSGGKHTCTFENLKTFSCQTSNFSKNIISDDDNENNDNYPEACFDECSKIRILQP